MLEVTVKSVNGQDRVKLNGYDKLTPGAARAAVNVSFGVAAHATVRADDGTEYRVTHSGVRKVQS